MKLTVLVLPFVLGWGLILQTGTPAVPAGDQ
jgi:hypothetical protein